MPRITRYHPSFETDVETARRWYDDITKAAVVGYDFVECVETAVVNLIAEPESRSTVDFGIRYWPVDRYP